MVFCKSIVMEMGSGRTRSSWEAEWTVQECLILINEIQAIESEWKQSLSSFQKWELVSQNCEALDVHRSRTQCSRKWDNLFSLYRIIKPHEAAYWAYDPIQRARLSLPHSFSAEVFQAIHNYFATAAPIPNHPDPDQDSNHLLFQTGFKKHKKRAVPQKRKIDKRLNPWRHVLGRKVNNEQYHLGGLVDPATSQIDVKVKSAAGTMKNCLDDSVERSNSWTVSEVKLEPSSVKVEEHSIATDLMENVKMINSILQGNLGEEDIDSKVATQIDFARLQGDKLIQHLGKISNTLEQLCNNFQQCN